MQNRLRLTAKVLKVGTMRRFPPLPWRSLLAISLFLGSTAATQACDLGAVRYGVAPDGQGSSYWSQPDKPVIDSKYAPDRNVEFQHLVLDVTPDFEKRTVSGVMTVRFKPVGKSIREIKLDAIDLAVEEVKSSATVANYINNDKEIVVTYAEPIPIGKETTLTIRYSAKPIYGLYFRSPSNGYAEADEHMFSQGEMIEARHWFPCFDHPNSKFTSEITCHVPDGMTVLSNGREVSKKKDPDGKTAFNWIQDKPHVNYLITLVAGKFRKVEDKYNDIPLSLYVPPSDFDEAPAAFAPTKAAMEFFEKEIGIPYPWAQYGQVVVHDYHHGGMENTSLTTLSESVLYPKDSENCYAYGGMFDCNSGYLSEAIVSHELAHQWFGDLVTCKDWSHVWLNEGFATYYSALFAGHKNGRDDMLYAMYQNLDMVTSWKDERPIFYRRFKEPLEQFSMNRAYAKASWVVHMIRAQLGEELFQRCIKTYVERYQFKTVGTEDLNSVLEELSGRSFDRFFDQWIYNAPIPELNVDYEWDEKEKVAKISLSQQQKTGEQRVKMQFPLSVRFKTRSGTVDRTFEVTQLDEHFYVHLERAPDIVRIDPEFSLLAKINFKPSTAMLYSQLEAKDDMIGRMLAADGLSDKTDDQSIAKLKHCLNNDPFFAVRIKASEALRKIHTDESLDALISGIDQPDARARVYVVKDIGKFFQPKAFSALLKQLKVDRNSAVISSAIFAIGVYNKPEAKEVLLKFLDSDSYKSRLAGAAIYAMRTQADTSFVQPIEETLKKKRSEFSVSTIGTALDAVAYLSRNEKNRESARNYIAEYLHDKKVSVQSSAIRALGTLEDPAAIPLLEAFSHSSKTSPQQSSAEQAIESIRSSNRSFDNLRELREQITDLQKAQREMKKEMEDAKKRAKAAAEEPNKKSSEHRSDASSTKKPSSTKKKISSGKGSNIKESYRKR